MSDFVGRYTAARSGKPKLTS